MNLRLVKNQSLKYVILLLKTGKTKMHLACIDLRLVTLMFFHYNARMLRKSLAAFLIFFWIIAAPVQASEYTYGEAQSQVTFTLKHLGIVTVTGRFEKFSGSFRFDPRQIENSKAEIHIQTGSVASGLEKRDKHLRSNKFFWSEKHPEILFVSKKFTDIRGKHFAMEGDLTIRGITRPVVFQTERLSETEDADGTTPIRFHTHTFIKRKDFQLGTGGLMDPIMLVTAETLQISLEIVGIPVTNRMEV